MERGYAVDEERLMILRMVQDGKITAEEGQALLDVVTEGEQRTNGPVPSHCSAVPPQRAGSSETPWVSCLGTLGSKLAGLGRLAALGSMGTGIETSETFTGEFEDDIAVVEVALGTKNGTITVKPWNQPGFEVVAVKKAHAAGEAEAREVSADVLAVCNTGRRLVVQAKENKSVGAVSLTVYLPGQRKYDLAADSRNGGINVTGIACEKCRVRSTNGGIRIVDVATFELKAETTNGGVRCDGVTARLARVQTTNGGIGWRGTALEAKMETTNGGIRVYPHSTSRLAETLRSGSLAEVSDYAMESTNGGITVDLSTDLKDAQVTLRAESGHDRIRLPESGWRVVHRRDEPGSHELMGEYAGRSDERLSLSAKTRHGSITIACLDYEDEGPKEVVSQ